MSQVAAVELELDQPQLMQLCPEEGWAPTPSTFPTAWLLQAGSLIVFIHSQKNPNYYTLPHLSKTPFLSILCLKRRKYLILGNCRLLVL